jgi:hypothetical protein
MDDKDGNQNSPRESRFKASSEGEAVCSECGRPVRMGRTICSRCADHERDDDDDLDEPVRRRQRVEAVQPTDFLIPTYVSGWAIASCYFGLIGLALPCVGLVFAIPAFICGIIAIKKRSKLQTYGTVTSNIRAVLGLVFSGLAILLYGGGLVVVLLLRL